MMTACVHSAAAVLYISSMKFQSGPWLKSNELLSIFEVADSVRMATEDNYHYGTYTDVCVCRLSRRVGSGAGNVRPKAVSSRGKTPAISFNSAASWASTNTSSSKAKTSVSV